MIMEAKKLPLLIALIAVIGTFAAFVPQQAFGGISLPLCGNSVIDPGEDCDPPDFFTCDIFCQFIIPPFCGDGNVDVGIGEQCEPPNSLGCDADCQIVPFCGDGNVDPGEQCELPNTNICDASCQFIISPGGGQVEGETIIEPLCGLKKTVSGTDFTEDNNTPIVFPGPVVNNQVTDPEVSAFFANTGSGPARVDITNVGDWLDESLTTVFTGCNTKWSASPSAFAGMTSVCSPDPYIEILPAQTIVPSTFVERLHRVHATVPDSEFMITNLVTYTQVLELTVDCEIPAQCGFNEIELNGECVPFND